MSPKVSLHREAERPIYPMVAPLYDPETKRALVLTYMGDDSEDPDIGDIRVRVFQAPLGELLVDERVPDDVYTPFIKVGLLPEGASKEVEGLPQGVSCMLGIGLRPKQGQQLVSTVEPVRMGSHQIGQEPHAFGLG